MLRELFVDSSPPARRFLVPEVVQTSNMDCGPASLKCLLEGFGIPVSYGRLREACQTDVDGTSIDTLEDVAWQLGLEAEQVMAPYDHVLLPETEVLPAIVVIRLPNGLTHFVVVWRAHGALVQLMDPAMGRRWIPRQRFLRDLYIHTHPVSADAWNEWTASEGFTAPLDRRMAELGLPAERREHLIGTALDIPHWFGTAALDAVMRMVAALVQAKGLRPGKEAGNVLERFFQQSFDDDQPESGLVPEPYWSVQPSEDDEQTLLLKGAVLVRIGGKRHDAPSTRQAADAAVADIPAPPDAAAADTGGPEPEAESEPEPDEEEARPELSPELAAALGEPEMKPETEILHALRRDGLLTPAIVLVGLALATLGVTIEAMLLKGLLDIGRQLEVVEQRLGAVQLLLMFFAVMLLLEVPMAAIVTRMGRRLEARFRIRFLEKIPKLGDRYFHSRLTSDMSQRAHELRQLRALPRTALGFFRLVFQIALTTAGVIWLTPFSAPIAFLATAAQVALSFLSQPLLREQDLRLRTHIGALSRFYLDALLGLIPIRTHGAGTAVRREHEGLLVDWMHAAMAMFRVSLGIEVAQLLISSGFSVWLLFNYLEHQGEASGVLLLMYWTLKLPALGGQLADTAQAYPMLRNRVLRILEPLTAPDEEAMWGAAPNEDATESGAAESNATAEADSAAESGVDLAFQEVTVHAGGHTILEDVTFRLEAGEHVAIVGPSGAGKSSLVGLLLGWHRPAAGQILVDRQPLRGERLYQLRRETAWIDPAVQIWNRTLQQNLAYGASDSRTLDLEAVMDQADLIEILDRLPDGPNTPLGESGGLVSGGEGQRVRLGRAMLRPDVTLVIMDEPFRGLDRPKRRRLLRRARQHWQHATLLFISHDISEAMIFNRVLVIEHGHLVEDEAPRVLMESPRSRYRMLLEAEDAVRQRLWENRNWRRLWLESGEVTEHGGMEAWRNGVVE